MREIACMIEGKEIRKKKEKKRLKKQEVIGVKRGSREWLDLGVRVGGGKINNFFFLP